METRSARPSSTPVRRPSQQPQRGTFYFLALVIGVAFVLATLFTAWTPSSLLLSSSGDQLSLNPASQPTAQPAAANGPTATARLRPLVGVVAGHWGNDSGSVCADGLTEAKVNLDIATLVQKDLIQAGMDVELLQEFDPRLKGYQASALVSIHADSCEYINDQASGFKVAAALASPRPERAARLTSCLRSRYATATNLPLHSTSVTRDMTSYHAFGEIDENTTAAIIETGFLNLDREKLTARADLSAKGIADGILCYLHNEDVSAPAVPSAQPTGPAGAQPGSAPTGEPTISPTAQPGN
ncbi:MAG TPA: N-acetylmuramoyl-L-alanine amidase [Anaerolineales bacterium]